MKRGESGIQDVAREIEERGFPFVLSSDQPKGDKSIRFDLCPPTVKEEDTGAISEAVHSDVVGNESGVASSFKYQPGTEKIVSRAVQASTVLKFVRKTSSFEIDIGPGRAVSASSVAQTLDAIASKTLDHCVARHLTEGGDDRLMLNAMGQNKYYCSPFPEPSSTILRSSCTCSPPTVRGFSAARALLHDLWVNAVGVDDAFESIRRRILGCLGLDGSGTDVILHPSGSDAELIPVALAMARAGRLGCSRIVNIVTAAGEVGSGTALAAGAQHFSDFTPLGNAVKANEPLDGFLPVEVVELKPRKSDGNLKEDYDDRVLEAIGHAMSKDGRSFFIVHAVDGSKTGLRVPSQKLIESILESFGERVLVVLDACQLRSTRDELAWYLRRGGVVLITSSKFFSAPAFCGAVLIPERARNDMKEICCAPHGLCHYLTKLEVPPGMKALRDSLPEGPANLGLLLRWACGLAEMENFYEANLAGSVASRIWIDRVENMINRRRPVLSVVKDSDVHQRARDETRVAGCNSIISFRIEHVDGSRFFSMKEMRRVHRYLVSDGLSSLLRGSVSPMDKLIADRRCYVGQPVQLGDFGVLRIALSAPLASRLERPEELHLALVEDAIVLDKVELIAKHFIQLESVAPKL